MAEIIIDAGSGNSCKNDLFYVKRMLDELKAVDTGKHNITVKWQLFKQAGDNIPLNHLTFDHAYRYAEMLGYKTTASVFDIDSLKFLLNYDVPMIKIANNRDLDYLIGEMPRKIPVYRSCASGREWGKNYNSLNMICVSKYPATVEEYEDAFEIAHLLDFGWGISDHITDFTLWHKYQPEIYEVHFKLEDSTGLDAGPFSRTPEQLKEIL